MKERKTRVNRNKVKIGLDTCEFDVADFMSCHGTALMSCR